MVTAPMILPEGELSSPIIAFCTMADQEQDHEIEGAELAELPLTAEPEGDEQERVHHPRAQHLLDEGDVGHQDVHEAPTLSIAPAATDRGRI